MATNWELKEKIVDFLRLRQRAYQFAFPNPKGNAVLKDLAKFCHFGKVPYHPDQRKTDILIGRQEVFLRIIDHLNLDLDQLYDLYAKPSDLKPPKTE